jgi:hypothetical protein
LCGNRNGLIFPFARNFTNHSKGWSTVDHETIDNLLREIQNPPYEELVSENSKLKRAHNRKLGRLEMVEEELNEIRQLPNLNQLKEEYIAANDKNKFVIIEFQEYISYISSKSAKELLSSLIHDLMRGDEYNLTQIPERQLLDESHNKIANYKTKVRGVIQSAGESISPMVIEYLNHQYVGIVCCGIEILSNTNDSEAISQIRNLIDSDKQIVSGLARKALICLGDNDSKQLFAELIDGFDLMEDGHILSSSEFPIEIDLLHLSRRLVDQIGWEEFIHFYLDYLIGRFLESEQVLDDLSKHFQKHNRSFRSFYRWEDKRHALFEDLEGYSEQLARRSDNLFISKFTTEYIASIKPKLRPTKQLKSQLIFMIGTSNHTTIFQKTINRMADVSHTLENLSWKHEKCKELAERRKVDRSIIYKFCDLISFDNTALELRENLDIKDSLMSILFEQLENFIERYQNTLTRDTNSGLIEMAADILKGPARDLFNSLSESKKIGWKQKEDYEFYFNCLMKFNPDGERFESLLINLIQNTDFQSSRMWEIVWRRRQDCNQSFAGIWEFIQSLDDERIGLAIQTLSSSTNGIEKSDDFENIIMLLENSNPELRDIAAKSLTKTTNTEFDEKAWPLILTELKRRPSEQLIRTAYRYYKFDHKLVEISNYFLELLKNREFEYIESIIRYTGRMKLSAVEEEFLKLLSLEDFEFLGGVLVAVGLLRLQSAKELVFHILENNKEKKVRCHAAETLGKIGLSPEDILRLKQVEQNDQDPMVRLHIRKEIK